MKHEIKKISKIIDELVTFFFKNDADEVDIKIKKNEKNIIIKIVDYNTCFSEEDIECITKLLCAQRQHEIESYYWQLAGEVDSDSELILVGAMIDEAKVEIIDKNLCIELTRYR
ncbi:MAG: hypothetical protein U9Q80_00610 [Bacillota bacterium]|nr:hypothetical protein [Bacillota bacterium]